MRFKETEIFNWTNTNENYWLNKQTLIRVQIASEKNTHKFC